LGGEVSRRLAEIGAYLPKGLMPASAADGKALQGAVTDGYGKVKTLSDGVKGEHLLYPQAKESDDLVNELDSAATTAQLAIGDSALAAVSLGSLGKTGEEAVNVYSDLCAAKDLSDTLAGKTGAAAQQQGEHDAAGDLVAYR